MTDASSAEETRADAVESAESAEPQKRLLDCVIIPAAQAIALTGGLAIVLPLETSRMFASAESEGGVFSFLFNWNVDTTPWLVMLAFLPFAWRKTGRRHVKSGTGAKSFAWLTTSPSSPSNRNRGLTLCLAFVIGVIGFMMHRAVGQTNVGNEKQVVRFDDLPPAYHDEYSYLFQARTFQAGRFSFDSVEFMPQIFDQMHVLNEGRMASRYFPGVGAWIAPFDALGDPVIGHWLAGALAAAFVFLAGREIGGTATGLVAGGLFALAPGVSLFGNLLLAHHPTLAALCCFLFAYLRFRRTQSNVWAMVAGTALVFAMLCRPMTAAGFGLPFGIHLFCSDVGRSIRRKSLKPLAGIGSMAIPIACGFGFLLFYNQAITGEAFKTPYQIYTDTYTPRHVYGFNNVVRGEQHLGPKVIENYDTWAQNLDWSLAVSNVYRRVIASFQWTLGIVPIAMALSATLLLFAFVRNGFRLVVLSFLSLHIAHVPYWFDGIMHWHYVFETAPLLCLICAVVFVRFAMWWMAEGRSRMIVWGVLVLTASFLPAYFPFESLWATPRLKAGVSEVAFSRGQYAQLNSKVDELVERGPAERKYLVLVVPESDDRHIDYVLNNPGLVDQVIFGRAESDWLTNRSTDDSNLAKVDRLLFRSRCCSFQCGQWPLDFAGEWI